MTCSDLQLAAQLASPERAEMSASEVYKACAALANNGLIHEEEKALSPAEKALLDVRRFAKNRQLGRAGALLDQLRSYGLSPLLEGDRLFQQANLCHWVGDQRGAAQYMAKAAAEFFKGGERRRRLRAQINQLICNADLSTCNFGELFALEQECRREGFHDLIAAIQRTRALLFLRANRVAEALPEAWASVHSYDFDGCPEDRAVSVALAAMTELLSGHSQEAHQARVQLRIIDGKVAAYASTLDALIKGRSPKLQAGHPLSGISWMSLVTKPRTIPAKLIERLRLGPATRDELIIALWGADATDPSYCGRLYTAINAARKVTGVQLQFDGERYLIL